MSTAPIPSLEPAMVRPESRCRRLPAFAVAVLATLLAAPVSASEFQPAGKEPLVIVNEVAQIPAPADGVMRDPGSSLQPHALGGSLLEEVEPNDSTATATMIAGAAARVRARIWPVGDIDYYSFTGSAGDRIYAATATSFAAGATDTTLTLFDTDGTTIIEVDLNDGVFAANSSSIAGATLPADGTYFLQVRSTGATTSIRPYDLYFQRRSGSPTTETEPNNLGDGGQAMPASGWASGAINPVGDTDVFTFALNAGDTVFLSLDLDPERDGGTSWNGRVGIGPIDGFILVANDANTTSPNSEAFFFTVREGGTYYAYVDPATAVGGPNLTYHLSVSVFPGTPASPTCATYTSADTPVVIPDGPGLATSSITVPGNPRIADLDVSIELTHANMPDLDVVLRAPGGNRMVLFNDAGTNTQQAMNLRLDDEAAIPIGIFAVMAGMAYQPQGARRLDWFDGQDAGGTWTLQIHDDLAANGGTLTAWSITVCEAPPPPSCPAGTAPVTVFETDFNDDDGGFTASGVESEWAWGVPTFVPLDDCASGSSCWATDLAGTYNSNSNQTLTSPPIDLGGLVGPVLLHWSQKHQIENANWDNASVRVQQAGGANPMTVWEWDGTTMANQAVGNPTVTVPQSTGWARRTADISAFAGQSIEAAFNLSSDSTVNFAGMAIDDFTVTACEALPAIELSVTVVQGPVDPMNPACGTTSSIEIPAGAEVEYCFVVSNTGGVGLTRHTLVDSDLGTLFEDLPFALAPGSSAFLTQAATPAASTTNTATWTAFNPGPVDIATAIAQATVTVDPDTASFCNADTITIPGSGAATPYPSTIDVGGVGNSLTGLRVRLNRITHTWPDDIDVLLVGPQGQNLIIMSDAGGDGALSDTVLVFDDAASGPLPDNGQIVPGTYLPTNWGGGDSFPAPAPTPSGATQLATFNGSDPNGSWALYVVDDAAGDLGDIGLGWCLEVQSEVVLRPQIAVAPSDLWSSQPAGTVTSQTLVISNEGTDVLDWTIDEALAGGGADCDVPDDVPWLSLEHAAGSLAPGTDIDANVSIDSTGLPPGVYEARLCVHSNDPDPGPGAGTDLVIVPVTLTVEPSPAIGLAVTVGTDPGTCAGSSSLFVDAGTTVHYCYTVTNAGDVTLNLHDLVDDQLGSIFNGFDFALTPGASVDTVTAGVSASTVINAGVTNTATWTAYNAGPVNVTTAQASATVILAQPSITLQKTVGTDAGTCASTAFIAVAPGTDVTYCYTVTNTGNVTLNLHDLEDDQLGTLVAGFNHPLTPGSSVFLLETTTLNDSVVNTATWDAYNAGPVNVASDQDSAAVIVSDTIFADGFEGEG
jgi:subtilisin-like proprotein convertase family protein